jgi:hypothetical protein
MKSKNFQFGDGGCRTIQEDKDIFINNFQFNDGGREDCGFTGRTGDCVCRAISIALQIPYKKVYDELNELIVNSRNWKRKKTSGSRKGINKVFYKKYLADHGWKWVPCMLIGQGCKVHLKAEELPKGRIIARVSKHLVAVIDGVINDTHDCSRNGTRCVYGYFIKE